jgi:hypothetical protein
MATTTDTPKGGDPAKDSPEPTDTNSSKKPPGVDVSTTLVNPSPEPQPNLIPRQERMIEEFQVFVTFVFAISIFGVSTFSIIVGEMTDPKELWEDPWFSLQTVRTFLASAWLLFILTIATATYSLSMLVVMRQRYEGLMPEWTKKWNGIGIVASALMSHGIVGAFLCLSLALVAYVPVVGWLAVGCTSLFIVCSLSLTLFQVKWVK